MQSNGQGFAANFHRKLPARYAGKNSCWNSARFNKTNRSKKILIIAAGRNSFNIHVVLTISTCESINRNKVSWALLYVFMNEETTWHDWEILLVCWYRRIGSKAHMLSVWPYTYVCSVDSVQFVVTCDETAIIS